MAGSAVNEAAEAVRCMVLPVAGGALLVPGAALAEVVVVPGVDALASAPPWLAGFIGWRGLRIGLLDLTVAPGEMTPPGAGSARADEVPDERRSAARPGTQPGPQRIAVLHALGERPGLRYYGIAIAQLPTVVLAAEDSARAGLGGPWPPWVAADLGLADGPVLLPDFEVLERMLDEALSERG